MVVLSWCCPQCVDRSWGRTFMPTKIIPSPKPHTTQSTTQGCDAFKFTQMKSNTSFPQLPRWHLSSCYTFTAKNILRPRMAIRPPFSRFVQRKGVGNQWGMDDTSTPFVSGRKCSVENVFCQKVFSSVWYNRKENSPENLFLIRLYQVLQLIQHFCSFFTR